MEHLKSNAGGKLTEASSTRIEHWADGRRDILLGLNACQRPMKASDP